MIKYFIYECQQTLSKTGQNDGTGTQSASLFYLLRVIQAIHEDAKDSLSFFVN